MGRPYQRIYAAVDRIPRGRVATYGQIARLAGIPDQARRVGYALAALTDHRVAWHRVVNARGRISPRAVPEFERLQRALLEREGVVFGRDGALSLARFLWQPARRSAARSRARPRSSA